MGPQGSLQQLFVTSLPTLAGVSMEKVDWAWVCDMKMCHWVFVIYVYDGRGSWWVVCGWGRLVWGCFLRVGL